MGSSVDWEAQVSNLKIVTQRLSATPLKQLPPVTPSLVKSLYGCRQALLNIDKPKNRDASEALILTHKFFTQISSLLNERQAESRWVAVVLINRALELGGWETLQRSGGWIKGLLNILSKNDPTSSKKLAVLTATSIFLSTQDYPTLIREIATPSLPAFITSCLGLINAKSDYQAVGDVNASSLTNSILRSFQRLIPLYAPTFRPFAGRIKDGILPLLTPEILYITPGKGTSQSSSSRRVRSEETVAEAHSLLTQLHCCAPKSTSAEEWSVAIQNIVKGIQDVSSKLLEPFQTKTHLLHGISGAAQDHVVVEQAGPDRLGLPGWTGIHEGSSRLITELNLLKTYICMPTTSPVRLPVGSIVGILSTLLSKTTATVGLADKFRSTEQQNDLEALVAELPNIHVAAVEMMLALLDRLGELSLPCCEELLDQVLWVIKSEAYDVSIRNAIYIAVARLINLIGPALPKNTVLSLEGIIKQCCSDIIPAIPQQEIQASASIDAKSKKKNNSKAQTSTNADAFLNSAGFGARSVVYDGLHASAAQLLSTFLAKLPREHLPSSLRSTMDRTAVLCNNRNAMLASILNPVPGSASSKPESSLLPLLARLNPTSAETEALIRPRMPVLTLGNPSSTWTNESTENASESKALESWEQPLEAYTLLKAPEPGDTEMTTPLPSSPAENTDQPADALDTADSPGKRGRTESPIPPSPTSKRVRLGVDTADDEMPSDEFDPAAYTIATTSAAVAAAAADGDDDHLGDLYSGPDAHMGQDLAQSAGEAPPPDQQAEQDATAAHSESEDIAEPDGAALEHRTLGDVGAVGVQAVAVGSSDDEDFEMPTLVLRGEFLADDDDDDDQGEEE